jgi:hypothetical protein
MTEPLSKAERNYLQAGVNQVTHYNKYGDVGEFTGDLYERCDMRWEKLSDSEKARINAILEKLTWDDVMEVYSINGYT